MGTTPKGAPFPDGTAKVVDGDDAIEALAYWVDGMYGWRHQGGQTIVTTGDFGQFDITTPVPAGMYASVIFQDGDSGTSGFILFGAAVRTDNTRPTISGFARHVTTVGQWYANMTIRVNWNAYG
jgi:hypothetical protein